MKIGLDIDSVLLKTMKSYLEVYNNKYNKNIQYNEINKWDFRPILGIDTKEMFNIFESIDYSRVELMDKYIPETINYFKNKGYIIDLITANTKEMTEIKCKRLKQLGVNFDNVKRVDVQGGDKGIYAKNYLFIVDDSIEQLDSILKNGGIPICYSQPWNRDWQGFNIYNFKQLRCMIR